MAKPNLSVSGGTSSVTVEDLSAQIDVLKNDLSSLTQTLADFGVAKTNEAKNAASKTAADLQKAGRERALEAQLHAEEFMQKQPATSLGIAAGVGFLVGIFAARR